MITRHRADVATTVAALVLALTSGLALGPAAAASGTTSVAPRQHYVYRGVLSEADQPASGAYDVRVTLYAREGAVEALAGPIMLHGIDVRDGNFSVPIELAEPARLDAGAWIEVAVRGPDDADFVALEGRQHVKAIAGGTCWELTGNAGTAPAGNFVGTSDGAPLRIRGGGGIGVNTATPEATTVMTVLGGSGNGGTLWLQSPKGANVSHAHFGANGDWFLRSATNTGRIVLQDTATTAQVAIGTPTPEANVKLHVQAGVAPTLSASGITPTVKIESNGVAALDLAGASTAITMRNSGGAAALFRVDGNALTFSRLQIGVLGPGSELRIMEEGLGIGRDPLSNELEVEGNASKTTAGAWLAHSDARIKTDVRTIDGALGTLRRLRLVAFRYAPEYLARHPGIVDHDYYNVIAQEFAEVFPDWVQASGEKTAAGEPILQVDTHPITIVTAAAVQELHAEVQSRDAAAVRDAARIDVLESALATATLRNEALEARLARLERAVAATDR